jgi:hypothetical protein
MLTMQDCIELSELTEEEILAIAEHEHIPEMLATELGNYLMQSPTGELRIKRMIVEDIEAARQAKDHSRVLRLKLCLRHFLEHHARRLPAAGEAGSSPSKRG